eukprot:GHVP01010538.1.p1 GENE.GHVP01010538.1~~GHVP01010538.1.p1  ORF type:complete len:761 (+),score=204.96 GHVP01010538.1:1170-3452(+)
MKSLLCCFILPFAMRGEVKLGGSVTQEQLKEQKGETFEFQAKISRVMNLFINSLYTNDEVFLRELLSNASDALSKMRTQAIVEGTHSSEDLGIVLEIDEKNNALIIRDNGVGMTREELIKNLGTIAESGTTEFLKKIDEGQDMNAMIGQFGVGFYSAFLVADRIVVASRGYKEEKQNVWDCDSSAASYTVYEDPRGTTLERGTEICLYLKKKANGYLDPKNVKNLVKKYGEFYLFPINLRYPKEVTKEIEGEENEKEKSKITTIEIQDELLNATKPIWKRDPKEVTDEEYKEFYKSLTKDDNEPLAWKHFRMEGNVEFSGIMFIPKVSQYNPYVSEEGDKVTLSLHVKHVFITNKARLLPKHLEFVRGVVDSESLPLNVSREVLQNNKILHVIRKRLFGKLAELLQEMTEDPIKYERFYEAYGGHIRLQVYKEPEEKKFLSLIRYHSSISNDKKISLDEYIEKMKEGQKKIFYLAGETVDKIKNSVYLESLLTKGYPVLYLTDPLEEPGVLSIGKYQDKPFQDACKEGVSLGKTKEEKKLESERFKTLAKWITDILVDNVSKVRISQRLTSSPCAIVSKKTGWSPNMERVMAGQAGAANDPMSAFYRTQKKIFEINPENPIILKLNEIVMAEKQTKEHEKYLRVLYDSALIRSGIPVKNAKVFSSNIEALLGNVFGVEQTGEEYIVDDISKREDIKRRAKYEAEKKKYERERNKDDKDKVEIPEEEEEVDVLEDEIILTDDDDKKTKGDDDNEDEEKLDL